MKKFRLAVPVVVVLLGCCAAYASAADARTVTVDLREIVTRPFLGLGVQWDPYEYPPSPEAWRLTLARLDHMRPALFRVMWRADAYCLGFDNDGNPKYVWADGESAAEERLRPLFDILDYAQSRGIDVMLGEWSWPRGLRVPAGAAIAGPQDPRWARIITDFVVYLTGRRKYTILKYYNYMNEPNGGWMWPGRKVDYAAWAAGIRNLREEFDAHGLAWLPIAGPDNSGSWDWLDRCARELPREIGAWEMHWYARDSAVLEGEIEKLLGEKREVLLRTDPEAARKPRFLAEAGLIEGKINGDQQPRVKTFEYGVLMADLAAQVARAGWMGAIAWDLDDAMHAVNGRDHPVPPAATTLKVWGFWNTQGTAMGHPEDEVLRPWYYTWSLMSRLFPKGAAIVASDGTPESAGVRSLAAAWNGPEGRRLSVMLVNESAEPRTLKVRAPGAGKGAVTIYRYFEADRPADKDGFPAPAAAPPGDLEDGVTIEMPSRGVIFLAAGSGSGHVGREVAGGAAAP